jgi:hypothetical protein
MNIIFDIDDILPQNIYFLEQKKNIIMDGNFTKLIYSNELFTMNGIYLHFSIHDFNHDIIMNKNCLQFHPYEPKNTYYVQTLSRIESHILELYKKTYRCPKKISTNLAKQLYSGVLKITRDYYADQGHHKPIDGVTKYMIKISSVWENSEDVGVTFKLMEIGVDP